MIYRMSNSTENIVDEILVMDAQIGNARALEILVERWQRRLWQHANRLAGDTQAAWDITQQSWLAIIKGLRRLQDPQHFKAWAYRITTNKAIDWIRAGRRTKHIGIEEVRDRQCKTETDTRVKDLLEKLDTKKKAVLSLYYLEQLTVAETAAALRIPPGTVKSRLSNARKELKKLWQEYFGD